MQEEKTIDVEIEFSETGSISKVRAERMPANTLYSVDSLGSELVEHAKAKTGQAIDYSVGLGKRMVERLMSVAAKAVSKMASIDPQNRRELTDKIKRAAVDGISVEDNEELLEMWANLLANAANNSLPMIDPLVPDILTKLSADDIRRIGTFVSEHNSAAVIAIKRVELPNWTVTRAAKAYSATMIHLTDKFQYSKLVTLGIVAKANEESPAQITLLGWEVLRIAGILDNPFNPFRYEVTREEINRKA